LLKEIEDTTSAIEIGKEYLQNLPNNEMKGVALDFVKFIPKLTTQLEDLTEKLNKYIQ
jgi:hypothetical protein